ncbi:hypothetical protein CB1_001354003 [Camelus ferus]|nr:hypothetical protein CB1_001354003 [Camelus ferus]
MVEMSRLRPRNTCKIFVGNVWAVCTSQDLHSLFKRRGRLIECDLVKDYAFVHKENKADAKAAITQLRWQRKLRLSFCSSSTKSSLDYRHLPDAHSDYARCSGSYNDYLRTGQMHSGDQRHL